DRSRTPPLARCRSDEQRLVEVLRRFAPVFWVSLNAYWPLWRIEGRIVEALRPSRQWGFGDQPEAFRVDGTGAIVAMRRQYLHVIGEPPSAAPAHGSVKSSRRVRRWVQYAAL